MPFKRSKDSPISSLAVVLRWLLVFLLSGVFIFVLARVWWTMNQAGNHGWPEAVLLILAVAGTVASLSQHLPMQNVFASAVIIALVGGGATWLDLKTGIPFGQFLPADDIGPVLLHKLPWMSPLIWVVAILNARGTGRLILRPWRKTSTYGFWLIGLTAMLATAFDFALEPFATRAKGYWIWEPTKFPVTWQGAPLVNFFGWLVVSLLILAFITPLLINKHPTHRHPPDFHPLGVWLCALLLFGAGAASHGLWLAAAANGILGVVVAVFAIRGSRW
jgi:uncharacterized membrane protein